MAVNRRELQIHGITLKWFNAWGTSRAGDARHSKILRGHGTPTWVAELCCLRTTALVVHAPGTDFAHRIAT